MGWSLKEYDPKKSAFQNFCDLEELSPENFEMWRLKGGHIHFAMRSAEGELFTAIAYVDLFHDPKGKEPVLFGAKVVTMDMGFVEPLHRHIQKFYEENQKVVVQ